MTTCHLHIEGLSLDAELIKRQFGSAAPIAMPILARADARTLAGGESFSEPLRLHGIVNHGAQGIAPLMLAGESFPSTDGYWMCATPAHLRVEQDRLVLLDARLLSIESYEAEALTATLNTHFAEDQLRFFAPHPQRWYMQLPCAPGITTYPLASVMGRDVHPKLPQGTDALLWHRRYNEAQMLLHAHPVNAAREARGLPAINSLWWWGEGLLQPVSRRFSSIHSDDILLRGLARLSNTPLSSPPANAAAWLAALAHEGEHYLTLDSLALAWVYRDYAAWIDARAHVEQLWLAPLTAAVKKNQIQGLCIDAVTTEGATRVTLTRAQLWRFWRDWKRA